MDCKEALSVAERGIAAGCSSHDMRDALSVLQAAVEYVEACHGRDKIDLEGGDLTRAEMAVDAAWSALLAAEKER